MPFGAPLRGCIPILVTPFRDGGSLDMPSLLGTVERGAVGALPASNIKRYFAEVQHLLRAATGPRPSGGSPPSSPTCSGGEATSPQPICACQRWPSIDRPAPARLVSSAVAGRARVIPSRLGKRICRQRGEMPRGARHRVDFWSRIMPLPVKSTTRRAVLSPLPRWWHAGSGGIAAPRPRRARRLWWPRPKRRVPSFPPDRCG